MNIEHLLKDGKKIVDRKIKSLKKTQVSLDSISEHLKATHSIKQIEGVFRQCLEERFFLTVGWGGDVYNFEEFMRKLTLLYKQCNAMDVSYKFNQGFLLLYQDTKKIDKIFLEIPNYIENTPNLITIPSGTFLCEAFDNDNLTVGIEKYITDKAYPSGSILIIKELYDTKIEYEPTPVEFQLCLCNI